jgi:hypothetical protein
MSVSNKLPIEGVSAVKSRKAKLAALLTAGP